MEYLNLLREILASTDAAVPVSNSGKAFPAYELRFILEYVQKPDLATEQERVSSALRSSRFQLLELDAALEKFLVLRFIGVERTLAPRELFAIGYALADVLELVSAEPDVGSDFFADPEQEIENPTIEATNVLDGLCWVKGDAPPDRRWALQIAGVTDAWAMSRGDGIVVGQPDTGITKHDQLGDEMLDMTRAFDIIDGDADPQDPLSSEMANPGHGTGTASVVAGKETAQMSGVAPQARVAPIRCIEDVKVFNAAPVAAAIAHAERAGCHIISMSLGGVPSRALHAAVRVAIESDLIVIAAAGNCVRTVVWPARYKEVIAVAGTNIDNKPWKGSCRGGSVDICAPAEFVWRAQRNSVSDPASIVSGGQGTSFAAAMVAGIAALWLAHHGRDAVITEARQRGVSVQRLFKVALQSTAKRPPDWDVEDFGPGVIHARNLLDLKLAEIPLAHSEVAEEPVQSMQRLLDEEFGPAASDTGFPWDRYESEIAMIALNQARLTGSAGTLKTEAKTQGTRPSPQLSEAASQSADTRLLRFAERSGKTSLSRPPSVAPGALQITRMRIGLPRKGLGLESAGVFDPQKARSYLLGTGKVEQIDRFAKLLDAGRPLDAKDRNLVIGSIEEGIDQFVQGRPLNLSGLMGLEALVRLTGRPALRVRNNDIDENDPRVKEWQDQLFLAKQDNSLQNRMAKVGRIDVDGVHMGTGFVVGTGIVLTNRHVLQTFAAPVPTRNNPQKWIVTSARVTIDFADEPSSETTATRFHIKSVIGAGPDEIRDDLIDFTCLDAALLEVETVNSVGKTLPAPMELVRDKGKSDPGKVIFMVGYPGRPSVLPRDAAGKIDVEIAARLNQLFGADYGTKYLSPGEIMLASGQSERDARKWMLTHDATTLGGCSGSFIVNQDDPMGVVGLHFGGHWMRENYAHSMGALAAGENFLLRTDINWKG